MSPVGIEVTTPPPNMTLPLNPIREHRQSRKLTQQEYAVEYGLSLSTVRRLEEGTLVSVPAPLCYEVSDTVYWKWITDCRKHPYTKRVLSRIPPNLVGHPFSTFIMALHSERAVARWLRVPPKAINAYMHSKSAVVPSSIKVALEMVEYAHLSELITLQRRYANNAK